MYTCEQSRQLLWDLLYDLLEAEQSQALRDHLAGCAACRGALERAQTDKRLVARAARWIETVPPFQVPEAEAATNSRTPHTAPPVTLPMRRPTTRRVFRPWVAAAAAVLVLVGGTYGLYRHGLSQREGALTAAAGAIAQIDGQRQTIRQQELQDEQQAATALRRQQLHVSVVGPAHCEPGVAAEYRVQTRDLDGKPASARVAVRLINPMGGKSLAEKADLDSHGDLVVKLPALPADAARTTAWLEVVARGDGDAETLRQMVGTAPRYLTHLALDKLVYRPGDLVFFRSVTLDRVTLRPPETPILLHYTLRSSDDRPIFRVSGPSQDSGIGGGEFPLVDNAKGLPDGAYTLTVEDSQMLSPPVRRQLFIQRGRKPGEKPSLPKQPSDGPTTVEFFPEGGNLVAGVENRVYVRVRTPSDRPAGLDGILLDRDGKEIARVGSAVTLAPNQAVGVFSFTPRLGQEYRLKVTAPAGLKDVSLPAAQKSGLALSVPAGVTRTGEPIRARLTHPDLKERELVVAVSCRGRLVGQRSVIAPPGTTEVRLELPNEAAGILRLTVLEQLGGRLWPVAERLVYRVPAERLVLSAETDRARYQPGERVKVKVRATTEKGVPVPAWLLAAVVDEQAAGNETSLPAQFYLASQVQRPEDLEQADVLLRDGPQAAQALDLFLGTQGWRRFTGPEQRGTAPFAGPAEMSVVMLDNAALAERKFEGARVAQLERMRHDYEVRDQQLKAEWADGLVALSRADDALHAYRTRAHEYTRLGLGVATLALFAVGCLTLVIGLGRTVLGRPASRPYFGTALAALMLCVVSFLTFSGPSDDGTGSRNVVAGTDPEQLPTLKANPTGLPYAPLAVAMMDGRRPAVPGMTDGDAQKLLQARSQGDRPALAADKRFVQAEHRLWNHNAEMHAQVLGPRPGNVAQPAATGSQEGGPTSGIHLETYVHTEYAPVGGDFHETVLWCPALPVGPNGTVELPAFTLSDSGASYRVLLYGHSATGRLGAFTRTIESKRGR
jgi:hypothetical protein